MAVILKCSKIIEKKIGFVSVIDLSVRQYKEESRIIYIGQGSQVIQIAEENLDEFVEFLRESLTLITDEERKGFLK